MTIGRDVPLPPAPGGRWVPIRGSTTRVDDDPLGPDERACLQLGRRLATARLALLFAFQGGLLTAFWGGAGATNAFENAKRALVGAPSVVVAADAGSWTPVVVGGLAWMAVAGAAAVGASLGRVWLLARSHDGGTHAWRVSRLVDPDGALDPEARWRAILTHEQAHGGVRPESVVRWTRALRAPPDAALRPWIQALREALKDGEARAQEVMASSRAGGEAEVAFGGATYEAADLCATCRTALEHVREVLARI